MVTNVLGCTWVVTLVSIGLRVEVGPYQALVVMFCSGLMLADGAMMLRLGSWWFSDLSCHKGFDSGNPDMFQRKKMHFKDLQGTSMGTSMHFMWHFQTEDALVHRGSFGSRIPCRWNHQRSPRVTSPELKPLASHDHDRCRIGKLDEANHGRHRQTHHGRPRFKEIYG